MSIELKINLQKAILIHIAKPLREVPEDDLLELINDLRELGGIGERVAEVINRLRLYAKATDG
jgi:endonuclease III